MENSREKECIFCEQSVAVLRLSLPGVERYFRFYTLLTHNIDKSWYNNGKEKEMIA